MNSEYSVSRYFYFLLKYRLHISIFSFILLAQFYRTYLNSEPDWFVVVSFFIWNFALYLFDRAYDAERDVISQKYEAISAIEKKPLILVSVLLSVTPVLILWLGHKSIIPYLFFIPLTYLYTYPVFNGKRLKDFLFIKNLYSGIFIWSLPVLVTAYFYINEQIIDFQSLLIHQIFPLFIYIMIGEAFWDIRDIDGDRINGVKTIPVVFGLIPTKIYLYSLLLIDVIANHFSISEPQIIYAVLILIVNSKSPRWIFHLPPLIALFRWFLSLHSS